MTNDSYRRLLLLVSEMEGDRETYGALVESALDDLDDPVEVSLLAAFLALDGGDIAEARGHLDRLTKGVDSLRPDVAHQAASWRTGALAIVDLIAGEPKPVRRWLTTSGADYRDSKLARHIIPQFLSTLLEAGLDEELRIATAGERFTASSEPFHRGIRAELAGEHEQAAEFYSTALEAGTRHSVIDESEIHLARARMASALGDDPRHHLDAAATRLARWPGLRLTKVEALLGGSSRVEPPGGLTPREREVALLVSRGLTNGGIADELFISTKTASVHVSNILAKLSMASRAEIAGWVAGGGLD